MGKFYLGKSQVSNPVIVSALERLVNNKELVHLHDGDTTFTEQELANILDRFEPERNEINGSDLSAHRSLDQTLTEEDFRVLAAAYYQYFQNGHKQVESIYRSTFHSLDSYTNPINQLDITKAQDPKSVLFNTIQNHDFTFVGDSHIVDDEKIFRLMMTELKRAGLKNLAIELPVDQQPALNNFFETGNTNQFTSPFDKMAMYESGLMALFKTAYQEGIKVVCIDQPYQEQNDQANREGFLAKQLQSLEGKTMVWCGAAHAARDSLPYDSLRTLVDQAGYSTAGIKLESKNCINAARFTGYTGNASMVCNAYSTYFMTSEPERALAYASAELGALTFTDPTPASSGDRTLSYATAFDYVIFLPESDSRSVIDLR